MMTDYPNLLIRASAGSGKTYRLSNRYLGLLRHDVQPDQVLATTFTRKAAGEILDRVMVRLAEAALNKQDRDRLATAIGDSTLSKADCLEALRRLIRHLHRLRVCTLDAFFAQLASSFSLELGLPPGWRIIEPVRDGNLRREAIAMTLQDGSRSEVDRLLHLMAKGEARRSISTLIQSTVDDLYGLYLETEPSAWQRIPKPKMLRDKEIDAAIAAIQEAPLPDDSRAAAAREKDVAAAEQGDWTGFIGKGFGAKVLDGATTYQRKTIPAELIAAYQTLLEHARAALLHQVANQTEATYELLNKFHNAYEQLKHNARAVRFDDITRTLARNAAIGDIRQQQFRLDTAIHHLLLDEFQDTSLAQWHVLRPFARDITERNRADAPPASSPDASFFCVGDVKQAIYGWRGGLSEIFDALEGELTGLTEESMDVSYRSSQPVIDAVNQIFQQATRHPNLERYEAGVTHWCDSFQEHSTARKNLRGYVELVVAPAPGDDENKKDVKTQYAARRIAEMVKQAPESSIGVLVRSNDAVAHMIYELRHQQIPASEEGGNPLTDSPAVQLILSLLKLADHPGDTIAAFHVASSPLGAALGFTDHTQATRSLGLATKVRSSLLHEGYGPTILSWARMLQPHCDRRDGNRLRQFVELAYDYQSIATLRTAEFLAHVEAQRVADPTTAEVRVMTIHQAKGLQFDIVVLPDLDNNLAGQASSCVVGQPSPTEPVDRVCLYRGSAIQKLLPVELQELFDTEVRRNVNEAMCVLYVAVTRAIHALHMIVLPSSASEKKLPKKPSGLLRAALTDGQPLEPETIAFSRGEPRWYEHTQPPISSESVAIVQPAKLKVKLASMPHDSRLEHTSPSQLEGGARVPASRVLDLKSSVATSRGTMIHALFEQITWLDDGVPEPRRLQDVAEQMNSAGLDVAKQLDAFARMVAMPNIAEVLCRSFYEAAEEASLLSAFGPKYAGKTLRAEVHNERRFVVRDDKQILAGVIDRLVLLYDQDQLVAADILDYKTDSVRESAPDALDQLVTHYQPQVDAYRRAVATMFRLPPQRIAARLAFVSVGIVRSL